MIDQLLLALRVVDRRHRGGDGAQLLLRSLPLALVDELLDLRELRRSQLNLDVAGGLLAEQCGAQAIERVAGTGTVDRRAETTQAQHRRRHRSHQRQRQPGPLARDRAVEGRDRIMGRHDTRGRAPGLVAPPGEQLGQLGLGRVGRVHLLVQRKRFDEPVGAADLVQ